MVELIEAKAYGPDSSEQEIAALRSCIYLYRPNVIYWKEVPVMSCWQVELFGQKLDELVKELDHFSMLIDLTHSKPPNAQIRQSLRKVLSPLKTAGLDKMAVFTGKNFLINVAAKFVLGGSGLEFLIYSQQHQAEKALGIHSDD